jgi:hypothetical protein
MPVAPTVSLSIRSSSSILASILATPDVGTVITSYELQRSLNQSTWASLPILINSVSEIERDYPFNTATPTKYVSQSGSVNGIPAYTTIQAAVNAAVPGDIIAVAPGTYYETVLITNSGTITSPIYIQALNPNNKPIIDGQDVRPSGTMSNGASGRLVCISASHIVWDSIDIMNSASQLMTIGPSSFNNGFFLQSYEINTWYANVKVLRSRIEKSNGRGFHTMNTDGVILGDCKLTETCRWDNVNGVYQDVFNSTTVQPQNWASAVSVMGKNVSVIECIIGQTIGEGIHAGGHISQGAGAFIQVENFIIRNCRVFDTWSSPLYVAAVDGGTFERNVFYNTGDTRFWYGRSGNPQYPPSTVLFASEGGRPGSGAPWSTGYIGSKNVTFRNNIAIGGLRCLGFGLEPGQLYQGIKIQNNTFFGAQPGTYSPGSGAIFNGMTNLTDLTLENNIIYDASGRVVASDPGWAPTLGTTVIRNNLWSHAPPALLTGTNSIVNLNAGLTNPSYLPNNPWPNLPVFDTNAFKLLSNSPAIGAGILNGITVDFFGSTRSSTSMDIGAHTVNAASGSSYEDTGLIPNTTYYYRARFTQSDTQTSPYSSNAQATTSSIPTNTQSAWRGAASAASTNSTGVTSLSLSKGSTQVGDIVGLIILVCNNTTAGSWAVPTFPAGFSTPVEIESDVNGYNKGFLVFKKAGSAEPDNYTVTYAHPNGTYRITAIRFTRYGHDDTNWLDQTPIAVFNNTASSNINLPAITPVGSDGAELISIAMTTDGNVNLPQVNISSASAETEYAEISDNSFYTTIQIASKPITGTSTIPARNASMPGFNAKSFGISVLLREPASAPPLPPPSGGNDGTLLPSNSPPTFNPLNTGVLTFDGVEDFIRTSTQLDSTSFSQFSIGIWFETDTANGAKLIGFESNQTGSSSSSYDRHLYIGTDGKLYFGIYKDGIVLVSTDYVVTDETWHYAVAVYDGIAMKLYMNGVLVGTTPLSSLDHYSGYWRIGGGTISGWTLAGSNPLFKGNIGTAHTYSRALTPTEVLTNYNARKGRYISGVLPTVSSDSTTSTSITVRVQVPSETGFSYPKFVVQRSSSVNGPWVTLPTINAPATTVTDIGLTSGTTYYYRAKAIRNDNKNTEWSQTIQIATN